MNHWAKKYIGMASQAGGRGPDKVDCWGLLYVIYKNEFGLELPSYPGVSLDHNPLLASHVIQKAIQDDWIQVKDPFDGCAVALSQRKEIHHIGIYAEADGGLIIHCWKSQNTIADTVKKIRMKGMQIIQFYRHRLWHTS